jgi:hypothetical protein
MRTMMVAMSDCCEIQHEKGFVPQIDEMAITMRKKGVCVCELLRLHEKSEREKAI